MPFQHSGLDFHSLSALGLTPTLPLTRTVVFICVGSGPELTHGATSELVSLSLFSHGTFMVRSPSTSHILILLFKLRQTSQFTLLWMQNPLRAAFLPARDHCVRIQGGTLCLFRASEAHHFNSPLVSITYENTLSSVVISSLPTPDHSTQHF